MRLRQCFYTRSNAWKGSDAILHVLAAAKAVEADLVNRMGEMESAALRNLLKQAILATDPGLPKLWQSPDTGTAA